MKSVYGLIITTLILLSLIGTVSGNTWLDCYEYRIPIEINNTGINLTNYQYSFIVDTASLVSAGRMNANGSDCRITNTTNTLLSFWNETTFNSSSTKIWVNATQLGNVSNTTHYMYYGNITAVDVSNLSNTFVDGSEFDDLSGWTQQSGTWTVSNGVLQIADTGGTINCLKRTNANPLNTDYIVRLRLKIDESTIVESNHRMFVVVNSPLTLNNINGNTILWYEQYQATPYNRIYHDSTSTPTYSTISDYPSHTWLISEIRINDTEDKITLWSDDLNTNYGSHATSNTKDGGDYWGFFTQYSKGECDWIMIRKYIVNEPTTSTGPQKSSLTLFYNSTNHYNNSVCSNSIVSLNRTELSADNTYWSAASVSGLSYLVFTEFNISNTTIAEFNTTNTIDWINCSNLTSNNTYVLEYSNGTDIEYQVASSSSVNFTTDIESSNYRIKLTIGVPTGFANSTGNFWIKYNWTTPIGTITDSYNVSQNFTWDNNTLVTYINDSVGPHGYSDVIIHAYNSTYDITSVGYLSDNVTVPNNIPTDPTNLEDLGMHVIDHTPTVNWTKGTDADGDIVITYVYVGITTTPTDVETSTVIETCELGHVITLSNGITYYYRLRSYDTYDYSTYTTADEFRMNSPPPTPTLNIPADGVEVDYTPIILTSNIVIDPEGDTVQYLFYVDKVAATTLIQTSTSHECGVSPERYILYYWKVRTYDGYEYSPGYSSVWEFTYMEDPRVNATLQTLRDNFFKGISIAALLPLAIAASMIIGGFITAAMYMKHKDDPYYKHKGISGTFIIKSLMLITIVGILLLIMVIITDEILMEFINSYIGT